MVNIEMANGKNIKIELYPDVAPITVANFEKLVKEGFYDGLIFHRVISGFMIQGQIQQAHSSLSCTRTLLILTDSMQHSAR